MKKYTTPDQTATLIELGFEKPKHTFTFKIIEHNDVKTDIDIPVSNYSIGELIEMLPEAICQSNDEDAHYFLSIETDSCLWKVFYEDECEDILCSTYGVNLIDALYDMVTMLKKEGTI